MSWLEPCRMPLTAAPVCELQSVCQEVNVGCPRRPGGEVRDRSVADGPARGVVGLVRRSAGTARRGAARRRLPVGTALRRARRKNSSSLSTASRLLTRPDTVAMATARSTPTPRSSTYTREWRRQAEHHGANSRAAQPEGEQRERSASRYQRPGPPRSAGRAAGHDRGLPPRGQIEACSHLPRAASVAVTAAQVSDDAVTVRPVRRIRPRERSRRVAVLGRLAAASSRADQVEHCDRRSRGSAAWPGGWPASGRRSAPLSTPERAGASPTRTADGRGRHGRRRDRRAPRPRAARGSPGGQQPADDDDLPAVPPELLAHLVDPLGVLAAGDPAHGRRTTEAADGEGDQVAGEGRDRRDEHDQLSERLSVVVADGGARTHDAPVAPTGTIVPAAPARRSGDSRGPSRQPVGQPPARPDHGRTTVSTGLRRRTAGVEPAGGHLGGEGVGGRPAGGACDCATADGAGPCPRPAFPMHGDSGPRADSA